jgi:hypothetical protein
MTTLPISPRFTIPIQFRPGTRLYDLRLNYGHNKDKHILMLEDTIADMERELEHQRFLIQRIHDNLEALS